jgi:hypothetical protein
VDRNPQKFVENIYNAKREDFIRATHRVYHSTGQASGVQILELK